MQSLEAARQAAQNEKAELQLQQGVFNEADIKDLEKAMGRPLVVTLLRSGNTGHDLDDK